MFKILGLVFLVLLYSAVQSKVKLAVDVIRHGARAPLRNSSFFPDITWSTSGELTPIGERQECLLGRLRRHQYIEGSSLLSVNYDPTTIYVRSTGTRRTLMSAQAYLICLYPTGLSKLNKIQWGHKYDLLLPPINFTINKEIIDKLDYDAMPFGLPVIPIQSVEHSSEGLLLYNDCPYIKKKVGDYFETESYKNLVKESEVWKEIMKAYPSITIDYLLNGMNAYLLADFIICSDGDGRRPISIEESGIKKLKEYYAKAQEGIFTMDELMNKIGMQELSKEILKFMNEIVNGKGKTKYVLYSGHDVSLVVILVGLKKIGATVETSQPLDFASNILFELDETDNRTMRVNIQLNGKNIYNKEYETFRKDFEELGNIGMDKKKACEAKLGLRMDEHFIDLSWTAEDEDMS